MPWFSSSLWSRIRCSLRDSDRVQSLAVLLIYVQIGCALIGSLSALFNGVLLINLVIALFALVAIESNSQTLARTYAALLMCAIMLDISWFILFTHTIWNIAPEKYGEFFVFSVRLALSMQIIGFSIRFCSSFLWIQIYRLGVSSVNHTIYREADFDIRNNFLDSPTYDISRQNSNSDDNLGGSIYDRTYSSSLLKDANDKRHAYEVSNHVTKHDIEIA
ncbi:uncharacterized protein [Typha angustifolia]|uniref:uncharacterized protein n=1 Tax=Typha angustifolia TaxID=59011 RepID=UPI003C2C2BE2